jgi:hypothetical protein
VRIMSLLDEIAGEARGPGPKCGIAKMLEGLDAADRDEWLLVLADRGHQHSVLGRVAKRRGLNVSNATIARHRQGLCSCDGES